MVFRPLIRKQDAAHIVNGSSVISILTYAALSKAASQLRAMLPFLNFFNECENTRPWVSRIGVYDPPRFSVGNATLCGDIKKLLNTSYAEKMTRTFRSVLFLTEVTSSFVGIAPDPACLDILRRSIRSPLRAGPKPHSRTVTPDAIPRITRRVTRSHSLRS